MLILFQKYDFWAHDFLISEQIALNFAVLCDV